MRTREGSSPGVKARGTGGPGSHTCVRSPSTPGASASTRPRWRGVAGAAGAGRAELGARRARGRAASPACSTAPTTRRAARRRPWPWPGPAPALLLRATCRCLLLRAARRLPSARPMGGGRHSGAERRGTSGVSSTGPRSDEPLKSARSSSRPAAGRRPASCT